MARVSDEFAAAVAEAGRAVGEFVAGDARTYRELWVHDGDTTIFGGWGGHEHGWDEVGPRLEWAAAQFGSGGRTGQTLISMACDGDLGYTVAIEHGTARVAGQVEPAPMQLRVTHVYRRIDGRWRVVHRHADPLTTRTAPEAVHDS
jgi:ketosteroid isomerase-like protein